MSCVFTSLEQTPRRRITRSLSGYRFHFYKTLKNVFPNSPYQFTFPSAKDENALEGADRSWERAQDTQKGGRGDMTSDGDPICSTPSHCSPRATSEAHTSSAIVSAFMDLFLRRSPSPSAKTAMTHGSPGWGQHREGRWNVLGMRGKALFISGEVDRQAWGQAGARASVHI